MLCADETEGVAEILTPIVIATSTIEILKDQIATSIQHQSYSKFKACVRETPSYDRRHELLASTSHVTLSGCRGIIAYSKAGHLAFAFV